MEDGCIIDKNRYSFNEICTECGYRAFSMSKRMFKLNYPRIMDNSEILYAMIEHEKQELDIDFEVK